MKNKRKKINSKNGGEKLINAMQIPLSSVMNMSRLEFNGNREVIVDGCKGILEYDENIIKINTGKMITKFSGRHLDIKCLTPDSLIIHGVIISIEFIT